MSDAETAFKSFIETHPDLWGSIGEAWQRQADSLADFERYSTMRETVCLVGRFTHDHFDAEAARAFG